MWTDDSVPGSHLAQHTGGAWQGTDVDSCWDYCLQDNRHADKYQTDRQADRQTDRQTDRQATNPTRELSGESQRVLLPELASDLDCCAAVNILEHGLSLHVQHPVLYNACVAGTKLLASVADKYGELCPLTLTGTTTIHTTEASEATGPEMPLLVPLRRSA